MFALAFHGAPRFTGDLDLLVRPASENASRVVAALDDFGFGDLGLSPTDFERPDRVIQLGVPPVRVDIVTSLTGVAWEEAVESSVPGRFGDVPVRYVGRDRLIDNKRAVGRKKDLADVEALGG